MTSIQITDNYIFQLISFFAYKSGLLSKAIKERWREMIKWPPDFACRSSISWGIFTTGFIGAADCNAEHQLSGH
jgi:hypothetical protein